MHRRSKCVHLGEAAQPHCQLKALWAQTMEHGSTSHRRRGRHHRGSSAGAGGVLAGAGLPGRRARWGPGRFLPLLG